MFVILHLDGHVIFGMNIAEFGMFAEKGTFVSYGHISSQLKIYTSVRDYSKIFANGCRIVTNGGRDQSLLMR